MSLSRIRGEIVRFRRHLQSDKFKGFEIERRACSIHREAGGYDEGCPLCHTTTERKDWISTADVDRFLAGLQSLTTE